MFLLCAMSTSALEISGGEGTSFLDLSFKIFKLRSRKVVKALCLRSKVKKPLNSGVVVVGSALYQPFVRAYLGEGCYCSIGSVHH